MIAAQLYELPDSPSRFALLDRELLRRIEAAAPHAHPDVERAWRLLRASGGRLPIEELGRQLGCSRRHLARRFAEDVGVSPKQAGRLMRFEAARRRLQAAVQPQALARPQGAAGRPSLARIAAECGYADQAHMTREFRAFAGAPPTAVPFVQEDVPAAA